MKMLERLRVERGISCTFVASNLKISRNRLRRIENEEVTLPAEFIPFLSNLYGISYKEVIEGRTKNEQNGKKINKGLRKT